MVTSHGSAEAVVTLAGEIEMSTVQVLARAIDEILGAEVPPRIVVDLSGVTFCDSQGLGTLVVLTRRVAMAHSCFILVNAGDFLLRVFDITGLRGALTIKN